MKFRFIFETTVFQLRCVDLPDFESYPEILTDLARAEGLMSFCGLIHLL